MSFSKTFPTILKQIFATERLISIKKLLTYARVFFNQCLKRFAWWTDCLFHLTIQFMHIFSFLYLICNYPFMTSTCRKNKYIKWLNVLNIGMLTTFCDPVRCSLQTMVYGSVRGFQIIFCRTHLNLIGFCKRSRIF